MFPLSKLTHQFGNHVIDANTGLEVFDVPTSHSLIQAAGYLKYIYAQNKYQGVFFRGQTKLYKDIPPSLFRNVHNGPAITNYRSILAEYLKKIKDENLALRAVKTECHEPLLQHYGIRTTWLDVVDNVWVALWFACHEARVTGWPEQYLHFERRTPSFLVDEDYAYILLLSSAFFNPVKGMVGYYKEDRSETIDLRVAVPSHFVRPHAQHAILIRRLSQSGQAVCDFSPLLVGIIRIRLSLALEWLGTALTLTSHSLFPPVLYDSGYRELLQNIKSSTRELGSIFRIQA